jgi:CubicO group peptidase (beta-lactamase class C family)
LFVFRPGKLGIAFVAIQIAGSRRDGRVRKVGGSRSTETLQRRVEEILAEAVENGTEVGLQAAAYLGQELVVDAAAGVADTRTGRAVDSTTLFHAFSCGKAVTATAVHLLADRGRLSYSAPIAAYWPEFGTRGKNAITVRHVLSHTSGVPRLPATTTLGDLCDWEVACRLICDLEPLWKPGSKTGYHGLTYGWILGEVVRRLDGRDIRSFVEQEITGPLGIDDCLGLGIPADLIARVAVHLDDGVVPPPALAGVLADEQPAAAWANDPAYLRACIPGTATGSARGLARLFAALANGGAFGGVRLLSEARLSAATAVAVDARDVLSGNLVRRGLGYLLGRSGHVMGDAGTFGHNGLGGTLVLADPAHGLSFALVKNNLTDDESETSTLSRVIRGLRTELEPSGSRPLPALRSRPTR